MKNIEKCFTDENGYGFIEYKGNNVLIHLCAFQKQNHDKDKIVELELVKTKKGYEKNKARIREVA